MTTYENLSGNSGVIAYDFDETSISVKFKGGSVYIYTYESAGKENIDTMKKLATSGRGLSTFVSQNVRNLFASKG